MRVSTLLTAVVITIVAAGCNNHGGAEVGPKIPVVRVEKPIVREVIDYEYFDGNTAAIDNVQIRSRVTGYLEKINFDDGKDVKKGDVLFEIDPRPFKAIYDNALGQVALCEAKLKLAKIELERGLVISKTPGAISQSDLDKMAADKSSAEAALASAKASAESAELNLKFTKVLAPVNGVVDRKNISEGNLVIADNTLLTTLVSMDPMYLYFNIDERTMLNIQKLIKEGKIKSVREGYKAAVQFRLANEGQDFPHSGEVDFVSNQLNTSTGTRQIRGTISNPKSEKGGLHSFTPGLYVRVRLPIGEAHKALLVPQAAVGSDQDKKYLYVVNDKNVVEYRPIELGAVQPQGLQVVRPLKIVKTKDGVRLANEGEAGEESLTASDQVVIGGLQRIRSGATVDPRPVADNRK